MKSALAPSLLPSSCAGLTFLLPWTGRGRGRPVTGSSTPRRAAQGEAHAQALPSAPTGVTAACAAPTTSKTIKVSWTAVTHATTYSVYDSTTSATGTYSLIASGVATTSWTSGTLTSGTHYWFEVTVNVGSNWASAKSTATGPEHDQRHQSLLHPAVGPAAAPARRGAVHEDWWHHSGRSPRPRAKDVPPMSFRVIQWATGGVGRAAMEGVLQHPELELAGAWVHSPAKEGADLGALLGRDDLGVAATTDVDALLAADADCVLYSPIFADPAVVAAILESGKNVVTPLGWFYPPPEEREKFDAIARAAGVTLHGTGINPGGITERFPLMISALSGSITHVRAEEFSDIRTYGAPDVVRDWMLFGKTPEEARASVMIDALGGGFRQSLFMVADELGFDVEPQLRTTHEMAVATAPIDSPIGPIQPGTVAAQRFTWEAVVDGAAGGHGDGQLADGGGAPRVPPGRSVPRASASRSRSPAIRDASRPSRSCTPRPWRPAWCATRASSPPPCTASTPFPTSAGPSPAC